MTLLDVSIKTQTILITFEIFQDTPQFLANGHQQPGNWLASGLKPLHPSTSIVAGWLFCLHFQFTGQTESNDHPRTGVQAYDGFDYWRVVADSESDKKVPRVTRLPGSREIATGM